MKGPRSATGPRRYGLGAAPGAGKVAVSAGGGKRAWCRAALRVPPVGRGAEAAARGFRFPEVVL